MAIDLSNPIEIINIRAPQWSSDIRIPDLVELAKLQTSDCYGDKYAYAVALRVLHTLASEKLNGGNSDGTDTGSGIAGAITGLKEGDLSESRGNTNSGIIGNAGDELSTTVYGKELLSMASACFSGPINRFSSPCP